MDLRIVFWCGRSNSGRGAVQLHVVGETGGQLLNARLAAVLDSDATSLGTSRRMADTEDVPGRQGTRTRPGTLRLESARSARCDESTRKIGQCPWSSATRTRIAVRGEEGNFGPEPGNRWSDRIRTRGQVDDPRLDPLRPCRGADVELLRHRGGPVAVGRDRRQRELGRPSAITRRPEASDQPELCSRKACGATSRQGWAMIRRARRPRSRDRWRPKRCRRNQGQVR